MVKQMTMDEFLRYVLTSFPQAIVDENQTGELVVFTGYRVYRVADEDVIVPVVADEAF
jgi:hypothetical protein